MLNFAGHQEERRQALIQRASQEGRTLLGGLFGRDAYSQAWRGQRQEIGQQYRQQKRELFEQWRRQERKMRQQQLPRQERKVLQYYDLPAWPKGPSSNMTWPERQASKKVARLGKSAWRDWRRQKQEQLRSLRHQRNAQIKQLSARLREQTGWKNNQATINMVTPMRPVTPGRPSSLSGYSRAA